jgi:hypothetical protein
VSPIKPENKARYPKDWKLISLAIRERSGGRCECEGECGLHAKRVSGDVRRCAEKNGLKARYAKGKVVLTVAHLDHTPENCDPSNLKAMCQRCHLRYDIAHHAKTRRKTRDAMTGQLSLGVE